MKSTNPEPIWQKQLGLFHFLKKEEQARVDAALALALALVNLIFLLACWSIIGVQSDESLNIYGALRLMAGERIYHDFWVYYTPGIFYLTAAVMSIFGKSLSALRMVLIVVSSMTAAILYLLGRKFMSRIPAATSTLLFILLGVNLWPVAVQHWYSTISLIFCLFFVARYLEDTFRLGSLAGGGLLAGLTFLLQQQKGGMLAVTVFLFVLMYLLTRREPPANRRHLARAVSVFGLGVTLPLALTALFFWYSGTLREAVSATILFPLSHVSANGGGFMSLYGWLTRPTLVRMAQFFEPRWIGQTAAIATTLIINVVAPLSVVLAFGWWTVRWLLRRRVNAVALLTFFGALVCLASSLQRPDFCHLLSGSPLLYLAMGYLIAAILPADSAASFAAPRKLAGVLAAFLILFAPIVVAAGELIYSSRVQKLWLGSSLGFLSTLNAGYNANNDVTSLIEYIKTNTQPNDPIFVVYASPFFYYLSERANPTPYPILAMSPCVSTGNVHLLDLSKSPFFEAQTNDAIEAVEAAATQLVVLDPAATCLISGSPKLQANPLANYLNDQFHPVGNFGDCIVLFRNQRGD